MGIFAFVIGVVAVVGLVLAAIALPRVKREGRAGFGLAVAGICLCALGVLLFVFFLVGLAVGDYSEEEVWDGRGRLPEQYRDGIFSGSRRSNV